MSRLDVLDKIKKSRQEFYEEKTREYQAALRAHNEAMREEQSALSNLAQSRQELNALSHNGEFAGEKRQKVSDQVGLDETRYNEAHFKVEYVTKPNLENARNQSIASAAALADIEEKIAQERAKFVPISRGNSAVTVLSPRDTSIVKFVAEAEAILDNPGAAAAAEAAEEAKKKKKSNSSSPQGTATIGGPWSTATNASGGGMPPGNSGTQQPPPPHRNGGPWWIWAIIAGLLVVVVAIVGILWATNSRTSQAAVQPISFTVQSPPVTVYQPQPASNSNTNTVTVGGGNTQPSQGSSSSTTSTTNQSSSTTTSPTQTTVQAPPTSAPDLSPKVSIETEPAIFISGGVYTIIAPTENYGQSGYVEAYAYTYDNRAVAHYQWTVMGPGLLGSYDGQKEVFYPQRVTTPTSCAVTVTVTDAEGRPASATINIMVTPPAPPAAPIPPSVNAGPNLTVNSGLSVVLQGSGSDPQGGPVTYHWTVTGGILSDYNVAQPIFYAPAVSTQTNVTATLTVTNSSGLTSTDATNISVNTTPTVTTQPQ